MKKYYNVGKLLLEAGKQYGDGIIKEYSKKLINELGKKYSVRYLFDIRKLYVFSKVHPLGAQLTMSHYRLLFPLTNEDEINYYINQVIEKNLSKRQLEMIIKSKEYERLPKETKLKKEHIGQIQTYMNYIDKNLRKINQDKTIGIIVCKRENEFIMEYVSDNRIYQVNYILN